MKRAILVTIVLVAFGCAQLHEQSAGISQQVEVRDGRRSVWGLNIRLNDASFVSEISSDHISIIEAKHSHDLRDIMVWSVSEGGKLLQIRFRPGCGDFGSGNTVRVRVARVALKGYNGPNNALDWSIGTDAY